MPDDEAPRDLVEDEGVNAGSGAAERDRRPSERPTVRPATGGPPDQPEPPERLLGPP